MLRRFAEKKIISTNFFTMRKTSAQRHSMRTHGYIIIFEVYVFGIYLYNSMKYKNFVIYTLHYILRFAFYKIHDMREKKT